jgi:hypothetical protein
MEHTTGPFIECPQCAADFGFIDEPVPRLNRRERLVLEDDEETEFVDTADYNFKHKPIPEPPVNVCDSYWSNPQPRVGCNIEIQRKAEEEYERLVALRLAGVIVETPYELKDYHMATPQEAYHAKMKLLEVILVHKDRMVAMKTMMRDGLALLNEMQECLDGIEGQIKDFDAFTKSQMELALKKTLEIAA